MSFYQKRLQEISKQLLWEAHDPAVLPKDAAILALEQLTELVLMVPEDETSNVVPFKRARQHQGHCLQTAGEGLMTERKGV